MVNGTSPNVEAHVTTSERIHYHSSRAMAELDLALRAGSEKAARAHARLSSLHLDRMRRLSDLRADLPSSLTPST